jgi:hypothetical protein
VISYTVLAPFREREIAYPFVARCLCRAAAKVSQSIPTFEQIFGAWERRPGDHPVTIQPPRGYEEPEYHPPAPEPLPGVSAGPGWGQAEQTRTGSVVVEYTDEEDE